jgi:hypothetical protein
LIQIELLCFGLLAQRIGAIASGVAMGLEDGTIRGCIPRTDEPTLRFLSVTLAIPLVVVAVDRLGYFLAFGWAFVVPYRLWIQ